MGQTYGGNLLGQLDSLGNDSVTGLNGTFDVDLAHLLAQIGLGREQLDEAVLNNQADVCTFFDGLLYSSVGLDDEFLATVSHTKCRLAWAILYTQDLP